MKNLLLFLCVVAGLILSAHGHGLRNPAIVASSIKKGSLPDVPALSAFATSYTYPDTILEYTTHTGTDFVNAEYRVYWRTNGGSSWTLSNVDFDGTANGEPDPTQYCPTPYQWDFKAVGRGHGSGMYNTTWVWVAGITNSAIPSCAPPAPTITLTDKTVTCTLNITSSTNGLFGCTIYADGVYVDNTNVADLPISLCGYGTDTAVITMSVTGDGVTFTTDESDQSGSAGACECP